MTGQARKLWIVAKAPVELGDAYELVGAFTSVPPPEATKCGPGRYLIAEVDAGRVYKSGTMLNVQCVTIPHQVMGARKI